MVDRYDIYKGSRKVEMTKNIVVAGLDGFLINLIHTSIRDALKIERYRVVFITS